MVRQTVILLALAAALMQGCGSGDSSSKNENKAPGTASTGADTASAAPGDTNSKEDAAGDSVFIQNDQNSPGREFKPGEVLPPPDSMRALYVNRWAAMGQKWGKFIDIAKKTEVNALVIDVKDDRGLTLYHSDVQVAKDIHAADGHCMKRDRVKQYLDTMQKYGIYSIARIVVVKDPLLAIGKPDWAIRSRADSSKPFRDRKGKMWLDPHQYEVWQYAVDLSREAVELGFDEIQFDYMRFPDEPGMKVKATFPLAQGRTRSQVVREMLDTCRTQIKAMGVRFTGDVFGLTTTAQDDMGIGQLWEGFADKLDVILPMAYPSHYARGSYGISYPNAAPYATILNSMKGAIRRSNKVKGTGEIIPWYQDFTLGAPRYGAHEVREQIRAGEELGLKGWVLWNPRSVYTLAALHPKKRNRAAAATDTTGMARR